MLARYSKKEIVGLAKSKGTLYYEDRTLEMRLDSVINFLNSKRAQKVLEWNSDEAKGDFFLNEEMNLDSKRCSEGEGAYQYNPITAIFLALLLNTYEESYFQHLLKKKYVPVDEGDDWVEKLEKEIDVFKVDWETQVKKGMWIKYRGIDKKESRSWEIININIMSQLYRLTLPNINEELIEEMENQIQIMTEKFLAMGEKSKVKTYEKIKNRINYIERQIEDVVNEMDYIEKLEYNTNLEVKSGKYTF